MFVERGRVEWADVPAPSLGDENSVLVRPLAVARCDLDLRMVQFRVLARVVPAAVPLVGEGA
jgi:hypothetical protein